MTRAPAPPDADPAPPWALRPGRASFWRALGVTALAAVAGVALVLWASATLKEAEGDRAEWDAGHKAERLRDTLQEALYDHTQALLLTAAFFEASDEVSGQDWRHFMGRMDPTSRPGFHAAGLIVEADPSRKDALHALLLREQGGTGEIRFGPGREHRIVAYREPPEPRWRQLGADLASDPVLLEALERTDRSRQPAMAVVDLELDPAQDEAGAEPGVVLLLTFGRPGQAVVPIPGWQGARASVYIALRLSPVVAPLLSDHGEILGLRIRQDKPAGRVLFDRYAEDEGLPGRTLSLDYLGERWLLDFQDRQGPGGVSRSNLVLVSGLLLALALTSLLWYLMTQQGRVQIEALRMNRALLERERQLGRQQAYLQRLVDQLPLPLVVKQASGRRVVLANRAFAQSLGLPDGALVGHCSHEFVDAPYAEAAHRAEDALLAGGQAEIQEIRFPAADGQPRFFLVQRALIQGPDEETLIAAVYSEITELRRQDQALRESELRWRFALEGTGDGVWDWDMRTNQVFHSPSWFAMLGFDSREDCRFGEGLLGMVHPDDLARTESLLAGLRGGVADTYANEYRLRDGQGHWRWVLTRGKVMERDEEGRPCRVLGTTADMTGRKRAEWALRESEARFKRIADTAPVLIWMTSPTGEMTYINKTWTQFTGRSFATELNEATREVIHPEDLPLALALAEPITRGRPSRGEFRMRRADGEYRWVLAQGEPLWDDLGNLAGHIGTSTDITDQKRAEAALHHQSEALAALVEEKTRDLVIARDGAQAANAAKTQFLANMSHELRTPLHAVLSYAKLGHTKAERMPVARLREYFDRIHISGDRLLRLLNDLLDLSKLEAGKVLMDFQTVNVAQVARDGAREFEALFQSRHIRLQLELAEGLPPVVGDSLRIGQVLRNLLSNAAKFTPEGRGVTLALSPATLAVEEGQEPLPAVRLVVSDEGIGIPEDELEAVFDKFVQSSKTRSGAGGTGLGLAICREIVLAHRGQIRAFGRAEGGACFEVLLPCQPGPAA